MAKFKVDTAALRDSAHQLRVCAGQLAIATECHNTESRLDLAEHEGSILALIEPGHEARSWLLHRRLEKASTVLSQAALMLAEAAREYDAGSLDALRLLDYGAGER